MGLAEAASRWKGKEPLHTYGGATSMRNYLYDSRRWRKLAKQQLQNHPLCKICLQNGLVEPATVVDHVIPHKGNRESFFLGAIQSLCRPCHDGTKQMIEKRGYDTTIGFDGWPIDPSIQ